MNFKSASLVLFMSFVAQSAFSQATGGEGSVFTAKISNIQSSTDFRYRFDSIDYESANPSIKDDQRLRVRWGLTGNVADANKFDFRITSGPGRTSTNQTLGANADSSSNYTLGIDRASVALGMGENTALTFGRMANPFVLAGGTDLAWDSDLNFDGISMKYTGTGDVAFTGSLSRFVLVSETGTKDSTYLNSAQVAVKSKIGESQGVMLTGAFYHYEGIKGQARLDSTNTYADNTMTGTPAGYAYQYGIADVGLEYSFPIFGQTFYFIGNAAMNTAIDQERSAHLVGFKINRLKNKGDWAVAYDFRRVERDSLIGAFTDAESFGGGVNGEGHRLNIGYQAGSSWFVAVTAFVGKKFISVGDAEKDRSRYLADLSFVF